jgi:Predicted flavoprotein
MTKVAVLVGSLRKDSINRKFAEALGKLAAGKLEFQFVELGDLPLYNDDLWENPPAAVTRFKDAIAAADAVLFVTPEYNRTYSPVIMNAIHWGSRPWGKSVWPNKPSAIVGATIGAIGTAAAQGALRGLVAGVGTILMTQPEVYFTYKPELFDAHGAVANEETQAFLSNFLDKFAAWIDKTK